MTIFVTLFMVIGQRWKEWRERRKWDAVHPTYWHL